jgi:hypothetical protein
LMSCITVYCIFSLQDVAYSEVTWVFWLLLRSISFFSLEKASHVFLMAFCYCLISLRYHFLHCNCHYGFDSVKTKITGIFSVGCQWQEVWWIKLYFYRCGQCSCTLRYLR